MLELGDIFDDSSKPYEKHDSSSHHKKTSLTFELYLAPSQGGREAQDFARILLQTYIKYCQKQNFKVEINLDTDNLQQLTVQIPLSHLNKESNPKAAFPLSEYGMHRLTRVSPFGNGKLHTSHVKVSVREKIAMQLPKIHEADVFFEPFKSSGPGGQHKNKTMSSIRAVHRPTGMTCIAQHSRSQHENRATAWVQMQEKWNSFHLDKHYGDKRDAWSQDKELPVIRHYLENHNQVVQTDGPTKRLQDFWRGNLPIPLKE